MADGNDPKQQLASGGETQGLKASAADESSVNSKSSQKRKKSKIKKAKNNSLGLASEDKTSEKVPSVASTTPGTGNISDVALALSSSAPNGSSLGAITSEKIETDTKTQKSSKEQSRNSHSCDLENSKLQTQGNKKLNKKEDRCDTVSSTCIIKEKSGIGDQGNSEAKENLDRSKGGQTDASAKQRAKVNKSVEDSPSSNSANTSGLKHRRIENNNRAGDGAADLGKGDNTNNNKPRPAKIREEDLTEEMLKTLAENNMHILKKQNQKFRNAHFFCRLCDFHLDYLDDCLKHIKDNRHCRRKEISEVDAVLRLIPAPLEEQLEALTVAVDSVWEARAIDFAEQTTRKEIVARLESLLQEHLSDVLLHMYGSSLTGFGLKGADINVNLSSSDKDRKLPYLLKEVHSVMKDKEGTGFSHIRADFSAKVPVLLLTDDATDLKVTMAIHCYSAHCSSELLAIYSDMDIRVRKLVVAFRYWAHLCGLDRQSDGFIPPQALNIMVIYFLQALDPQVIPIISPPKVSGEDVGDFRQDQPSFKKMRAKAMKCAKETKNRMSEGELWLELLRFYSLEFDTGGIVVSIRSSQPVPRTTKPWNCKKLAVEDPYMVKRNVTRMVNNSRIYEYWQDSIRKAYYYFGLPRDREGKSLVSEKELKTTSLVTDSFAEVSCARTPSSTKKYESDKVEGKKLKQSKPISGDVGEKHDSKENASSVDSKETVSIAPNPLILNMASPSKEKDSGLGESKPDKNSKPCVSQRDSPLQHESRSEQVLPESVEDRKERTKSASVDIEDTSLSLKSPADLSKSSAEPLEGSENVRQFARGYAEDIIVKAVSAISISASDLDLEKVPNAKQDTKSGVSECSVLSGSLHSDGERLPPSPIVDTHGCSLTEMGETAVKSSAELPAAGKADITSTDSAFSGDESSSKCLNSTTSSKSLPSPEKQEPREDFTSHAKSKHLCLYEFDENHFTDGKGPTLVCSFCEKEGHLKNSCPDDELPEVLNLPEMTDHHLKVLSETLSLVPSEVGLSEASIKSRWKFLDALQDFIQYQFDDAELTLFGSTCNGFGFDKSDMDICMTFCRRNGKIDKIHIIETLARRLKSYSELYNVQAISTAKVPIVKFTIRHSQLEGDISLYNTLAQRNTKLLYCYSQIDPRVRVLGYAIKTFAKVCDIGDASRGSLSSYAYILTMLYYLQQVRPPVIPVLQELYKGPKKPELIVDDCDAWFMEDLSKLDEFWPEKGQNKMSVAELWLGFLRFYVEEFNYKEYVVSIRQKALLTRFEKLWNGTCIAVEDPFDLSHNLGSGLTRKMNNFIFKTFINGRMLYGSPIDNNMDLFKSYQCPSDYFFDTELLSENRPPNVRGCRRCGKIGHLQRACPLNRKDREMEDQKQKQQQRQQQQQQQQRQPQQQQQQQRHQQQQQQQQRQQQQLRQPQRQQHQQQQQQMTKMLPSPMGRPQQQQQMMPRKSQDRVYAPQRQNQSQQQFRERDIRSHNDSRNSSTSSNSPQYSGYSTNGGNTNRNSSATSGSHPSSYGHLNVHGGLPTDRPPGYQQEHPQHHRMSHVPHTYHNSNFRQHHHQQQYQHHPHQQYYQQQHQQQQLRHHQQEQQRRAAMMAVSGNSLPVSPGFTMQPVMASTPRPNMGMPQHQQHQPPPNSGFGGMSQQQQQHRMGGPMAAHQQGLAGGSTGARSQHYYRETGENNNRGGNNQQGLNPVVQSLFSSAQGQVMEMNSSRIHNKYH